MLCIEEKLVEAKIPRKEIKEIISNLKKLVKTGISKEDTNIVIKNIIVNSSFRNAFLRELEVAIRKVRIEASTGI
ncbi:MAG: hypothetical protein ACFFD2_14160 [Promethearchaeota archaeon]